MSAVAHAVLLVATLGFIVAAMYLGGGSGAIRRQAPLLLALALLLVAISVVVPFAVKTLPGYVIVGGLIGINLAALVAWRRRPRRSPASPSGPALSEALRHPSFVLLAVAFGGIVIIATALLVVGSAVR